MIDTLFPGWIWVLVVLILLVAVVALALNLVTRVVARRVERGFPAEGRFADVNGHRLHYVDSADADTADLDKPALLLIHGLGGNLMNFTHSLDTALRDRFRIIALDRPGAGRSVRAKGSDHSLPTQARDVVTFINAVGLERPILVGHSLGGAISLAVGLDFPDKVAGIALIAPLTAPVDSTEVNPAFKPLMIDSPLRRKAVANTLAVPVGMRTGERTLRAVFHPETPPADFPERGGGLLGLRPSSFETTSADLMALEGALPVQHARYGELTVPVAVICGTNDPVTPFAEQAESFSTRTGARLQAVEGAGHMLPVTQPQTVANFVAECAEAWAETRVDKVT